MIGTARRAISTRRGDRRAGADAALSLRLRARARAALLARREAFAPLNGLSSRARGARFARRRRGSAALDGSAQGTRRGAQADRGLRLSLARRGARRARRRCRRQTPLRRSAAASSRSIDPGSVALLLSPRSGEGGAKRRTGRGEQGLSTRSGSCNPTWFRQRAIPHPAGCPSKDSRLTAYTCLPRRARGRKRLVFGMGDYGRLLIRGGCWR